MRSSLRYAIDPVAWTRECLHFDPDPPQARVLESQNNLLLNACRQFGKSTTSGAKALHRAIFFPRSLILLLSPTIRQSGELYRKVTDFMGELDHPPKLSEDNRLSCTLSDNGSRIVSLPGTEKTIRGYSGVDLILLDEAAQIPDSLFYATRPMLAVSGGQLIMMSTPFGRRGIFYEQYVNGSVDAWERIEVSAVDCPRISPDFLKEEREILGEWWYAQEYECQFMQTVDSVFKYDDIRAALDDEIDPLFSTSTPFRIEDVISDDVAPVVIIGGRR
jgi:hypothetical protein